MKIVLVSANHSLNPKCKSESVYFLLLYSVTCSQYNECTAIKTLVAKTQGVLKNLSVYGVKILLNLRRYR